MKTGKEEIFCWSLGFVETIKRRKKNNFTIINVISEDGKLMTELKGRSGIVQKLALFNKKK